MLNLPVYLDYNATTPCDPQVLEVMLPYFSQHFGNAASRQHLFGWQAEEAVDIARYQVARLLHADPSEIIFTSGATEGNNLAIKGAFEMYAGKGNHIITCVTEHKAVLDVCRMLEKKGASLTYLPVNEKGMISLEQLEAAITPATILISLMYANNETGVIHPVEAIGRMAKKHNVLFFCDATQAVGKVDVDVLRDGIDILSMSAHKFYGPKGVGALYVRRRNPRVKLAAQLDGGGHEKGMRSGTLNVPGIAGLGKAAELCGELMGQEKERLSLLRNRLEQGLLLLGDVFVNGDTLERLPHVSNLAFSQVEGNALMMGFNKDIAVAAGSACTSASMEPSFVLKALGLTDALARGSLRFSLGRFTTAAEIDYTIEQVAKTVLTLRALHSNLL